MSHEANEHCTCPLCIEFYYYQDLEAELEIQEELLMRDRKLPMPPKETPYDRPPAPNFFPHSGSPFVVEEEDGPYGPGRLGADSSLADEVNHPSHYQSKTGLEAIQVIEAATEDLSGFEGYCTGNAVKYLFRWKKKGGKQDLEKASWYIRKLLAAL